MTDEKQDELIIKLEKLINGYERLLRIKDKQIDVLLTQVAKTSLPVQMNAITRILQEIAENEFKND